MTELAANIPSFRLQTFAPAEAPATPSDSIDPWKWLVTQAVSASFGRLSRYENEVINRRWPPRPTSVNHHGDFDGSECLEAWVICPGFGSTDNQVRAELLRQQIPADRPVISIDISTDGTNRPELTDLLQRDVIDRYHPVYVSIFGHSMGLGRLMHGIAPLNVQLGRIVGDGSPNGLHTARYAQAAARLLPVFKRLSYHGGIGGKYGVTLLRQLDQMGFRHFPTAVRTAGRETMSGASPRRQYSEIGELVVAATLPPWEVFSGRITDHTPMLHCCAENPADDPVVRIELAHEGMKTYFKPLGAPVSRVGVKGGHAQSELSIPAASGWFRDTNEMLAA